MLLGSICPAIVSSGPQEPMGHTRSIVACDPAELACGIASVSFPTVAGKVAVAEPGVVVANQSLPHYPTARAVVEAVVDGVRLDEAMEAALEVSPYPWWQQMAAVALDSSEGSGVARAVFTGDLVNAEICSASGETFVVAANLQSETTICDEMARIFSETEGRLAKRLMTSLVAASRVGGDARGELSAVVEVYASNLSAAEQSPVTAIASVNRSRYWKHHLRWELIATLATETPPDLRDYIELTPSKIQRIQWVFGKLGFYSGQMSGEWSDAMEIALREFCNNNVFHPRLTTVRSDGKRYLDSILMDYITMGYFRGVLRDAQSGWFGY